MATPRLTLQALVDFVLTPGTINDAKLISEVRKHLQGIGDFKLPITPILDPKALKKSLGDKGLVGQIDKQIAGASKRLDNFQQKFVDLARTTATKGGGIFSEDAEANAKRAAKHAEAELASQRELLRLTRINEDALRRFAGTDVGSRLPETLKAMRDLQAGIVSKADLKRSGKLLDDVKQTAGFLTQHAARTGQIRAQAIKLEKKVAGPVLPDSGEATVVPGVPISIPGLTTTSKDLTKFAQDTAKALDDDRIAAATKKVNDHKAAVDALNERLKGTTKTSDALKKEMKKAGEVPFFKEFDDQVKGLKAGLKGTRTEFSRIGKAGDIDDQITERKRLEGVVKKGEGEIAKLRTGFETKIDKQRSESIGNTFKNVKALTETPTSQIQEEAGRRLLKGASTPAVAIQKAATVSDSRSIGTALRADAVKASAALDDYTKRVKTADAASDPVFKKLDDALVERRRLLDDNLAKTARLEKEASAVGQDDKTKRAAKLDLIPDDQSKKLSQARADLKAIDKTLTDSKLPARLKTDLERQANAFRDQINALQGSLDKGSAIGDLDQREEWEPFLNGW